MGKRLGQHFLRDPGILDRIVEAIDPDFGDVVLEIGPGDGALTRRLAPRVGHVVAIERDRALAAAMREAGISRCSVVEGDALDRDWPSVILQGTGAAVSGVSFKVIGNVPYYISTPLVEKALSYAEVELVVYLVQREVADRMAASAGTPAYGGLSVGVQSVANVERMFTVRPGAFNPPPKVDSAVVRLSPRRDPLVPPRARQPFRAFVTALFSHRRKQLGRSLRGVAGVDRKSAEEALRKAGIDPGARVEDLTPERIVGIFEEVG